MPPKGHALLSASSASRWLNCPPSARLCEDYEDKGSDYAQEGTDAHALCEFKLRKVLGTATEKDNPIENLTWYNGEMEDCADSYVSYIMEILAEAKQTCTDPVVLVEQRLDFSKYVKEGFGTGDCVIIADGTLHIVDFKYGKGVPVDATDNPQLKLYALGALELFDCLYDIDMVTLHIFQPRLANVNSYSLTKADLYNWAEETLKPTADLAWKGEGELHSGEWCRFCKAKSQCRERAKTNLMLAQYDFRQPPLLTDEEVESILGSIDELTNWAADIKEYALQAAVSGKQWQGYKLVEGRANRKYTDEDVIAEIVTKAGYDPYEHKVLGITSMEKLLGKKKFSELLGSFVRRPQGKPTLVPETDERPAMEINNVADSSTNTNTTTVANVVNDFKSHCDEPHYGKEEM